MCHIKTKDGIVSKSDLCGLITGLILRQNERFNKEDIIRLVKENSVGSLFVIDDNVLESMIEKRLNTYERNDDLQYRKGFYYPMAIESFL